MSFSAGIVQGRPARSGFGPLDGGDLGPTRCAVTKRGSHEGTHRAHQLPGLPPSAIISAGETGEPRVRDGQDFSARATLRYRASVSSPTSRHLARGRAAGCFRDQILIQDDRATDARRVAALQSMCWSHISRSRKTPDGVTEFARFESRFGDYVVANRDSEVPRASPGFALYRDAERQFSAV
jgi:hypothetical protein